MRNYFIKSPQPNNNTVELWSTKRLSFEPKDWLLEMKKDLKTVLMQLKSIDDAILYAFYSSRLQEYCDVENILLYNVGSGPFAHLCRKGLLIERKFELPPDCPSQLSSAPLHYHYYGIADKDACSQDWESDYLSAKWKNVPCPPLIGDIKPHAIWYTMKKGIADTYNCIDSSTPFGIQVTINAPAITRLNLSQTIKPLLDGIISAFHSHDGSNMEEITERLSKLIKSSKEDTAELLADSRKAVLSQRRLLHPFRQGLQWNPADDICVTAKVLLDTDNDWSISGELYTVKRKGF